MKRLRSKREEGLSFLFATIALFILTSLVLRGARETERTVQLYGIESIAARLQGRVVDVALSRESTSAPDDNLREEARGRCHRSFEGVGTVRISRWRCEVIPRENTVEEDVRMSGVRPVRIPPRKLFDAPKQSDEGTCQMGDTPSFERITPDEILTPGSIVSSRVCHSDATVTMKASRLEVPSNLRISQFIIDPGLDNATPFAVTVRGYSSIDALTIHGRGVVVLHSGGDVFIRSITCSSTESVVMIVSYTGSIALQAASGCKGFGLEAQSSLYYPSDTPLLARDYPHTPPSLATITFGLFPD